MRITLKSDNRMERNHLLGRDGDRINAILAACGFNLRKLFRAFLRDKGRISILV